MSDSNLGDQNSPATSGAPETITFPPIGPDDDWMVIDQEGDLFLRTPGTYAPNAYFRVSSTTLADASPVLKAMLFGPWKEAQRRDSAWVVALPEDSAVALRIILPVLHGEPPYEMRLFEHDINTLREVINFVDKYFLQEAFGPAIEEYVKIEGWEPPYRVDAFPADEFFKRLEMAWELGATDGLLVLLRSVVRTTTSEELNSREVRGKRFFQENPYILRHISLQRTCRLDSSMRFLQREYFRACEELPEADPVAQEASRSQCYAAKMAALNRNLVADTVEMVESLSDFEGNIVSWENMLEEAFLMFQPPPGHQCGTLLLEQYREERKYWDENHEIGDFLRVADMIRLSERRRKWSNSH